MKNNKQIYNAIITWISWVLYLALGFVFAHICWFLVQEPHLIYFLLAFSFWAVCWYYEEKEPFISTISSYMLFGFTAHIILTKTLLIEPNFSIFIFFYLLLDLGFNFSREYEFIKKED